VNLANNHILDYGWEGAQETVSLLNSAGIYAVGIGSELHQACQPIIKEVKGVKLGFFGYSLTFPQQFWATDSTAGTCFPYEEFVYDQVQQLKKQVDWVIINCHWGKELQEIPQKYQIRLAHRLIKAGADFIIGHHPHVIQSVEVFQGKFVAYSLGNFVFGSYSDNARVSMLVQIHLYPEHHYTVQLIPINIYNKEVEFQPLPLNEPERTQFFHHLTEISRELNPGSFVISSDGRIQIVTKRTPKNKIAN